MSNKSDEVIGNAPASPDVGYAGDEKNYDADAMKLAGKSPTLNSCRDLK